MNKDITKINDDIAVAMFDPEKNDFTNFKQQGYQTVINLQTADEGQNLSENAEQQTAKNNGLAYIHCPVSPKNMTADTVDDFRQKLKAASKPVVVHCKSGKRSGAFVMMHLARETDMTGEEAIEQAKNMGFECDQPELKEFLKKYINA